MSLLRLYKRKIKKESYKNDIQNNKNSYKLEETEIRSTVE